jgi:hypothetical protein
MGRLLRQVYEAQLDGTVTSLEEGIDRAKTLLSQRAIDMPAHKES